jgi:hypothetical protein
MAVGVLQSRAKLAGLIEQALQTELPAELKEAFTQWLKDKGQWRGFQSGCSQSTGSPGKGKHDRKQFACSRLRPERISW